MLYRALYTLTMYLLTPVILYRLALRGLRYREYLARWQERFGFFRDPGLDRPIWIHAVSMGEVNAAAPLIDALMRRHAETPFVITTVTPTGSMRVEKLYGGRVFHVYLPYDLPASVRRFLDRIRPRLAVIMETEIWPNLFFACHDRGIPIVMANARLSERSLRGYGPVRPLARRAIRRAAHVAAQSQPDAERLIRLGANRHRLSVAGNTKYDMQVPPGLDVDGARLRESWGAGRPVWIAASTHEGEESAVVEAHVRVLRRFPDALLLWCPRHPERFRHVAQLCRQFGFETATRSEDGTGRPGIQCFVGDTLGELLLFYAASDVAFVAGSLQPIGGHNVLEPAALARPVLVGPAMFNFEEITSTLEAADAIVRVRDAATLGDAVTRLFVDSAEARAIGERALRVFLSERGAVDRVMAIIDEVQATSARAHDALPARSRSPERRLPAD
jgi:3-deoxy-D-manno-octulosonic-acid transferase